MTALDIDPFADLRLTEWTSCGGCAAKWGASLLTDLVRETAAGLGPALLVGLAPFDDAAVYEVAPGVALVSTTDFFPPLVDDPERLRCDRRGQRVQRRVRDGRPGGDGGQRRRVPRALPA